MLRGSRSVAVSTQIELRTSDVPNEGYLWSQKHWWCQRWSILLTGVLVASGSWLLFHKLWITLPTIVGVLIWWLLFLVIAPAAYRQAANAAQPSDGEQLYD